MSDTWLDEKRQIIRQRVAGDIDVDRFSILEAEIEACVARLVNPNCVLILLDTRGAGKPSLRTRRAMMASLQRPNLGGVAVWTNDPIGRMIMRFAALASGQARMRGFATEEEAIGWLLSLSPRRT
jgi:hypothetical protein